MEYSTQEETKRKDALITDLNVAINFEDSRTKWNHATSFILLLLAIVASGMAAILGLGSVLSARWIGVIALLPTLLVLFERSFKFEQRGSWHKRKRNRLEDLRDQLIYQQPATPSLDQIAAINKKKHQLNYQMQQEWDTGLLLNWTAIDTHARGVSQTKEPPQSLQQAK